jgi:hypothetical protein
LSRSYEPSRATSRATRLACGLAQSALWCVARAVLAHARHCHARSARSSGVQRRSTRRGGGASTVPCTSIHGSTAGSHTSSSHGDGGTQGHEWPRSSFPSRCGSSVARRPAHGQGNHGDASRRRRSITGKRPRGRKGKGDAFVLTMGRRCSRGRLGEEVHVGEVGVHGGGLPQLRLLVSGTALGVPLNDGEILT